MRIVAVEKLPNKTKRFRIRLDNGADFVLYQGEVRRLGCMEGEELSAEEYRRIIEEILLPRAKQRTLYLLEKQDRTEHGLRQKLKEGGYPEEVIDGAVAYAASCHYIDDERYAENYVYFHKANRSRQRLKQDMLGKGIAKEIADAALDAGYGTDERALIAQLMEKKHYDPQTADVKEKAKMYRFLAGRGFAPGDITDMLKGQ